MSDFQVGDVVVCVNDGQVPGSSGQPCGVTRGCIYRVERTGTVLNRAAVWIIGKASLSPTGAFQAVRFRKLPKVDDQFIADLRACKPDRVPA